MVKLFTPRANSEITRSSDDNCYSVRTCSYISRDSRMSRATVSDDPRPDRRNKPTGLPPSGSIHSSRASLDLSNYDDAALSTALMQEVMSNTGIVSEKASCTKIKQDSIMPNRLCHNLLPEVTNQCASVNCPVKVPPIELSGEFNNATISVEPPPPRTLGVAKRAKEFYTAKKKAYSGKDKIDSDAMGEQRLHNEWYKVDRNSVLKRKAGEQGEIGAQKKCSRYSPTSTNVSDSLRQSLSSAPESRASNISIWASIAERQEERAKQRKASRDGSLLPNASCCGQSVTNADKPLDINQHKSRADTQIVALRGINDLGKEEILVHGATLIVKAALDECRTLNGQYTTNQAPQPTQARAPQLPTSFHTTLIRNRELPEATNDPYIAKNCSLTDEPKSAHDLRNLSESQCESSFSKCEQLETRALPSDDWTHEKLEGPMNTIVLSRIDPPKVNEAGKVLVEDERAPALSSLLSEKVSSMLVDADNINSLFEDERSEISECDNGTSEQVMGSKSKGMIQDGQEGEQRSAQIVGKWAEVAPHNSSGTLPHVSIAESEAFLMKRLQDAENKKEHTGTLSASELAKYSESNQKAESRNATVRSFSKGALSLQSHRGNNNPDQLNIPWKPPAVKGGGPTMAAPKHRKVERKSQAEHIKQKEHGSVEVNKHESHSLPEKSGRCVSRTPCAELDHGTEHNPSAQGFAALKGRPAIERPLGAAASAQLNSRRDCVANPEGQKVVKPLRGKPNDAQEAKKPRLKVGEDTKTVPLSLEENRRIKARKQREYRARRKLEKMEKLKADIKKFDHPPPHKSKSPVPHEQELEITHPAVEGPALPDVYESSVSSDEDETEEQYAERQRLKRAKLLQPATAAHEDVLVPPNSHRPTVGGKGIARKIVAPAVTVQQEKSDSEEDVSYQRPTVSGKGIPRKTVPLTVHTQPSLSDPDDAPNGPADHDDARSIASLAAEADSDAAAETDITSDTNNASRYHYHVTRTTTTSPPTTYGPFHTLDEANTAAHSNLLA